MTDKLKKYIEENSDLLETDVNALVFYCEGGGLSRKELIAILEQADISVSDSDVTKTDIIASLRRFAKSVGGKLTVSRGNMLKYTWPDGDLVQTADVDELMDIAKEGHLSLKILEQDCGILLDYFD